MPTYLHNCRKLPKHPYHPKNGWNTPKARKIAKIPLKPKKRPQYPWILGKHQNWRKYNVLFSENDYNTLVPKRRPTYPTYSTNGWDTPTTKKWLKYPRSKKYNWNTINAYGIFGLFSAVGGIWVSQPVFEFVG